MKISQITFCSYLLVIVAPAQSPALQQCLSAFCDPRCPTEVVGLQGETATYKVIICSDKKGRPTHYLGKKKTNGSSILIPLTNFNDFDGSSSKYVARNGKFTYTLILSENSQLIIKSPGKKPKIEAFIADQP